MNPPIPPNWAERLSLVSFGDSTHAEDFLRDYVSPRGGDKVVIVCGGRLWCLAVTPFAKVALDRCAARHGGVVSKPEPQDSGRPPKGAVIES